MRIFALTIIVIGLVSCGGTGRDRPETTAMTIKDLQAHDIVHNSLTTDQLNEIKKIHEVFSEINSSSLDETIDNFKRDQQPDNEIAIWKKMANAYQRFALKPENSTAHDKKVEAYELILLRTMMTEKEVVEKVDLKFLTKGEVTEILSYYTAEPQPLKVDTK